MDCVRDIRRMIYPPCRQRTALERGSPLLARQRAREARFQHQSFASNTLPPQHLDIATAIRRGLSYASREADR